MFPPGPENNVSLKSLQTSLLYQYVHNPFIGGIISNIIKGAHGHPPVLRENDDVAMGTNGGIGSGVKAVGSGVTQKTIYGASILAQVRTSLQLNARIRSSFVRVRGVPTYLFGQTYLKLFEFCVFSDGGAVPIGLLRRQRSSNNGPTVQSQSVLRKLMLNVPQNSLIEKGDVYICTIPSKYNNLLKRKHLLEASLKDTKDSHYSRQLNERTLKLIAEQIDVVVDIRVRMQQAHDSREATMTREKERIKSGLGASKKKKTSNTVSPEVQSGGGDGGGGGGGGEREENEEEEVGEEDVIENQDIATQVVSLLRSTTSLLSILTWRQKRTITLRGDTTIPGASALIESQQMYQETCMSESLVEMMKERDIRIRDMKREHVQSSIEQGIEESTNNI